jgi:hypothetical protein
MSSAAHNALLAQVIAEHREHPVDMLGIGDAAGESEYLTTLADFYRRYFYANTGASTGLFAGLARKLLYLVPSFRPFLVVSARKVDAPAHDFLRADANS